MEHTLHPQPGYPFVVRLSIAYELRADGLGVQTTATNVGAGVCPFGAGAHPRLLAGAPLDDTIELIVPADTVLRSDERGIPIGPVGVDETELDFRAARTVGSVQMDHAFTDLGRDGSGLARVAIRRPDGIAIEVWFDERYPYVMLTTGDVLPDVDRRSIAVEPMTCPPNAFQSGTDVIRLLPGDAFTGRWGIRVRLPGDRVGTDGPGT
jgi:aldose 1-epimerase